MTDVDKIAIAIALVIIFTAAEFALGIFFRRLTDVERQSLPNSGSLAKMKPIGFVHF